MTVRLITHATRNYLPRMRPYLASLQAHSPFETWLLTVDCDAPEEFMADFPRVRALRVPVVPGAPEYSASLQHGAWLPYVPGEPHDLDLYTDGDIVLQRRPSPDELNWLTRIGAGEVACGYNSGPGETLALEATRLFPRRDPAEVFGDTVRSTPCYNIGVIAARRGTWARIHDSYLTGYPDALALFGGPQRQQWLVCYVFGLLGLTVRVMPYSMHTHGCYALPEGAALEPGVLMFRGEPVLFRHHV